MFGPRVFVLILSYNGKHLLEDSLSSYLENDYPNFEVVVIDNGSTDRTIRYAEKFFPKAKVIRIEKNRGYSGGFNFGLDFAFNKNDADYALISNNDVKADKNVISELVRVAESNPEIGFVSGKVYFYDEPNKLQTVGKKDHPVMLVGANIGRGEKDRGQYDEIKEYNFIDDVFLLVRRSSFDIKWFFFRNHNFFFYCINSLNDISLLEIHTKCTMRNPC